MKKTLLIICAMLLLGNSRAMALEVSAEYACVMLAQTGEVIYEKNAYVQHSMASTTKIMTALVALENCGLEDVVTVSRNASMQEGSSMYLHPGDQITMENLLYGLMLNSGNDAAVAIAEHVAGTAEIFAEMMTARARELGAENTQFKNPNGLDADGHYTTAYDLALITRAAMKNDTFRQIVKTKSKTVSLAGGGADLYLGNHNKMLQLYDGAIGVKTGFTKATGRCLVSAAARDGVEVIAVTLQAPDDWNDHTRMLDDAFSRYAEATVFHAGDCLRETEVAGEPVQVLVGEDVKTVSPKGEQPKAEVVVHLAENLSGPVIQGEKIGYMEVKTGDQSQAVPLLCDRAVERKPSGWELFCQAFLRVAAVWFLGK